MNNIGHSFFIQHQQRINICFIPLILLFFLPKTQSVSQHFFHLTENTHHARETTNTPFRPHQRTGSITSSDQNNII